MTSTPSRWARKLTPQYCQLKLGGNSRFHSRLSLARSDLRRPCKCPRSGRMASTWVVASQATAHRRDVSQETTAVTLLRARGTQKPGYKTRLEQAGSAGLLVPASTD